MLHGPSLNSYAKGVEAVISCGDLPFEYLEYVVTFLGVPVYYVLGNHDPAPDSPEHPGGCTPLDGRVVDAGGGALVVAAPGGSVGPLGLQGAVEPLGLTVGPGPAGLDEPAGDAELGADGDPGLADAVALGVVGQHPAHRDAAGGEPGRRPGQEAGAGGRALVAQHLGVGQPGVIVDGDV